MLEGMLKDICGADIFNSIYDTLSINWFGSGGGDALSAVQGIYNTIQPVAIMLMFIYFMIAVVDKLSGDNFTWEQLWRQMAMFLASYYLVTHLFDIMELLFEIGMNVAASVSSYSNSVTNSSLDAAQMLENFEKNWGIDGFSIGIINKVVMFLYLLIPWLLSWIMRLCVSVVCYSRIIEIYARATFAPIAISDFFHTGMHGGGWRFLKNFLAVSLQGAMILAISVIYSKLFTTMSFNDTNMFTFIGKYLAFYASAVMLMFKSLSLTKEIVGTGG